MRSTTAVLGALLWAMLFGSAVDVQAAVKEVVVLTTFPKELLEVHTQASEQRFPGVRMIVAVGHGRQGQLRQGQGAGRLGSRPHQTGGERCHG